MHEAPRIRAAVPARMAFLIAGLFVFAAGIVMIYEARLGLSSWDVLNQGIARHSPLSFGTANIAVALTLLLGARRLSSPIGIGTLLNAVLVGAFVDLLLGIQWVATLAHCSLAVRGLLLAGGIAAIALGSALYIGAALGAGPRDSLMLGLARRTGRRIGLVRTLIEGSVTAGGFALGGTVGAGTIVFAVAIGPAIEMAFRLLAGVRRRRPLGAAPA